LRPTPLPKRRGTITSDPSKVRVRVEGKVRAKQKPGGGKRRGRFRSEVAHMRTQEIGYEEERQRGKTLGIRKGLFEGDHNEKIPKIRTKGKTEPGG